MREIDSQIQKRRGGGRVMCVDGGREGGNTGLIGVVMHTTRI